MTDRTKSPASLSQADGAPRLRCQAHTFDEGDPHQPSAPQRVGEAGVPDDRSTSLKLMGLLGLGVRLTRS